MILRGQIVGGTFQPYSGGIYGALDRVQPYGFASTPPDECEAMGSLQGDTAWVIGDLDGSRPTTAKGETTIYDKHGNTIIFTSAGIVVESSDGNKVTISDNIVVEASSGDKVTLSDTLKIEAGGTRMEMSGGNIYLGCDPLTDEMVAILAVSATAPYFAALENVFGKKP